MERKLSEMEEELKVSIVFQFPYQNFNQWAQHMWLHFSIYIWKYIETTGNAECNDIEYLTRFGIYFTYSLNLVLVCIFSETE